MQVSSNKGKDRWLLNTLSLHTKMDLFLLFFASSLFEFNESLYVILRAQSSNSRYSFLAVLVERV